MRLIGIMAMLSALYVGSSHASNPWQDLQRQFPTLNLQHLESANSSMHVLLAPTQTASTRGTIVLLPDQQHHAFSPDLFNQLRLVLPNAGWQLVMLPEPEAVSALTANAALTLRKNQLAARWQLLQQQNTLVGPVIAVAQGETAMLLNLLLLDEKTTAPAALVNLGAYLNPLPEQATLTALASQPIPVLDLITYNDHPLAQHKLAVRQQHAKQQHNALYRQRVFPASQHDASMQQWLAQEILGWLKTSGF